MTRIGIQVEKAKLVFSLIKYRITTALNDLTLPQPVNILRGKLLRRRVYIREHALVEGYELNQDFSHLRIVPQTFRLARRLLIWLVFLIVFSVIMDNFTLTLFRLLNLSQIGEMSFNVTVGESLSPINLAMSQVIGIYITAIATILALFFALYVVGFQTSIQDYSVDVAQFINDESIQNLFFSWLLAALFFNILVLLRIWLIELPAVASFLVATGLSILSLAMILVYRTHYVWASRPEQVLRRILIEFHQALQLVGNTRSPFSKSQLLSAKASNDVHNLVSITGKIYSDLLSNNAIEAASLTPMTIAYMLCAYAGIKHKLRDDNTRWFRQKMVPIDRNNFSMHTIATAASLRGEGTLHYPARNSEWLEGELCDLLEMMIAKAKTSAAPQSVTLLRGIIATHKLLLFGDYSQDNYGRTNIKEKGLFELQAFDLFDFILNQYIDIWPSIQRNETLIPTYLEVLFQIGYVVLDGFSPTVLEQAPKSTLFDGKLVELNQLEQYDFSPLVDGVVHKWWSKLSTELEIEGELITRQDIVEKSIAAELQDAEIQSIQRFFPKVQAHIEKMIPDLSSKHRLFAFRGQLYWLKRAFYRERSVLLDSFTSIFSSEMAQTLFTTDVSVLEENQFNLELDDILFLSLTSRSKSLFEKTCQIRSIVYYNLSRTSTVPQTSFPLIISLAEAGGLAYAYSELWQDEFWVEVYTKEISKFYKSIETLRIIFHDFMGGTIRYPYWTLQNETYFDHWYNVFAEKLKQLPIEYDTQSHRFAPEARYKHASEFIRHFDVNHGVSFMRLGEDSTKAYIEWLKTKENAT